jgi:proton-translocating NAD(P)+ transhydrogenase subunit alpha
MISPAALDPALANIRLMTRSAASQAGPLGHPFVFRFSIFVLAAFVGYYVVWSVTPAPAHAADVGDNAISSQ